MAKYLAGIILLICTACKCCAQANNPLQGKVVDSLNNPISDAIVSLVLQNGSSFAFALTDKNGTFSCIVPQEKVKQQIWIKVSCLGYLTTKIELNKGSEGSYYLIKLQYEKFQLSSVTVKSTTGLLKKMLSSDTLNFAITDFIEKSDRSIIDVIAKLPGITIGTNGQILFNGKPVSKVYIDGENLTDSKYAIVTNSIPANYVSKIQVIERDQPIKALNGYVLSNNTALNLVLADSAKAKIINTCEAGIGTKSALLTNINNLTFKKGVKSINRFQSNNIGNNLSNEVSDFGVNLDDNTAPPIMQPYLSVNSGALPLIDERLYLNNNDYLGTINTLIHTSKNTTIRFNLNCLYSKGLFNYDYLNAVFLAGGSAINYNEIQSSKVESNTWQGTIAVETNKAKFYLSSISTFDLPKSNIFAKTTTNDSVIHQSLDRPSQSFSNKTILIIPLNNYNSIEYASFVQFKNSSEKLHITPGLYESILNTNKPYSQLLQNLYTNDFYISQNIQYRYKSRVFAGAAEVGANYTSSNLNSNLFKDSAGSIEATGGNYINDVPYKKATVYCGINAIFTLSKYLLSVKLTPTISNIAYNALPYNLFSKTYFNPKAEIKIRRKIKRFHELELSFYDRTDFGEINNIYPFFILTDYRTFNENHSLLPVEKSISYNFKYQFNNPLKLLFWNIGLLYKKGTQNFISTYTVDGNMTTTNAIPYNNVSHYYLISSGVSKILYHINSTLSLNGNYTVATGNNYVNNAIVPYGLKNIKLSIDDRIKFSKKLILQVYYERNWLFRSQNTAVQSSANIKNNLFKAEGSYQITSNLSLSSSFNSYSYKIIGTSNANTNILNASVKFSIKGVAGNFEVTGTNLANFAAYQFTSLTAYSTSAWNIPLRPRQVIIKYYVNF